MDTFRKYLEIAQSEPIRPFESGQTVYANYTKGLWGWCKVTYVPSSARVSVKPIGGNVIFDIGFRAAFRPEEAAQFGQTMPIPDKAPVRCWDDEDCEVRIRFFDAKNKATFMARRERNGTKFNHYELIPESDIPAAFGSRERYEAMLAKLEE